jgi:hypothetical protein
MPCYVTSTGEDTSYNNALFVKTTFLPGTFIPGSRFEYEEAYVFDEPDVDESITLNTLRLKLKFFNYP